MGLRLELSAGRFKAEVEATVRVAGQAREGEAEEASDASSSVTLSSISSKRVKEVGEERED